MAGIWIRTLAVLASYAVAIALVHRALGALAHEWLRLALSFVLVQSAAIIVLLAILLTRRGIAQRRARRSRHVAADAHAAVAEHAGGADRLRVLRALQKESRRDVAGAVGAFLSATRGTMHERVSTLSRDLGISEREVIEGGTIERAAAGSLLDRALIADEMQSRAESIVAAEMPRALRDDRLVLAALDLLLAWRRVFDVEGFEHALTHANAQVRQRAFAALPYVHPSRETSIETGLRDADPRVRAAAANAAARIRLDHPLLETLLDDEDLDVAVAAAFALAATKPDALRLHPENRAAFEALEKTTMGRLEYA